MSDQSSSVRNLRARTRALFTKKATKENLGEIAVALVGVGFFVLQTRRMYIWHLKRQCPKYSIFMRGKLKGDLKTEIAENRLSIRCTNDIRGGKDREYFIDNFTKGGYEMIEKKGHNPKVVYNDKDNTTFIKIDMTRTLEPEKE